MKGGAKSATLVEIGLRSNFRVVLYKNSCYVKRSALPLFCSCDQNPWKIPGKESRWSPISVHLQTVQLLKQDSTTGVLMKTFQNFWNRYFLCNTSRLLLLNLLTILIVPARSLLPYLCVVTREGGGLTSSGFYVGSPSG